MDEGEGKPSRWNTLRALRVHRRGPPEADDPTEGANRAEDGGQARGSDNSSVHSGRARVASAGELIEGRTTSNHRQDALMIRFVPGVILGRSIDERS